MKKKITENWNKENAHTEPLEKNWTNEVSDENDDVPLDRREWSLNTENVDQQSLQFTMSNALPGKIQI